ncbi:ABC transporter substrate-binding protein [Azospirillum sp. ST 5-10]|uniref:ABC transporter substrate-binding protein n=1 Tax=unclassified Azospirillum TaxID=2630922 RepID=UPI003F4A2050
MGRGMTLGGVVLAVMIGISGTAAAEPGVDAGRIVFGQVAALDGPAGALGRGMRAGILAAFAEANAAGGVDGRRLELLSRDDGGDPDRAAAETRGLIDGQEVFALVGAVGTATAAAAQPLAEAAGVPFIGPLSGAADLRDPALRTVVNLRPSFEQEAEAWIAGLTGALGARRIAILYQDDAFGRAGLAGVERAMEAHGLPPVARGAYPRNTTAVKAALLTIRKTDPEAVVMVGAAAPCAEFIRLAHRLKLDPAFVAVSAADARALAAEPGMAGARLAVSQVLPSPEDGTVPLVAAFRTALAAAAETPPDAASLEGYAVGRLVVEALARTPGEPTRAGLLHAVADGGPFDLGGLVLRFGPGDNQGADGVRFTVIGPDGGLRTVDGLAGLKG